MTACPRGGLVAVVSAYSAADFPGGAERLAWEEVRLLAPERPVVFVNTSAVAPAPFTQVRIGAWLRRLHDPRTGASSPFAKALFHGLLPFNPVAFIEALAVFRRLRPSVVHTHNLVGLSPSVWLAARLAGARVVHTHHDLSLLCQRATMTRKDGYPCGQRSAVCAVCRATRVVKRAQTPLLARELFPSRWLRARLGRSGEIVRPFASVPPPVEPPDVFSVLFLGRLTPSKGVAVLLEAVSRAGVTLTVAGEGPLEPAVRAAQGVTFAGFADDQARARLLAQAGVVVIPSVGPEVAPLVFFEAFAAGVPAILSDVGGLSELAEFGSAILVPAGNAEALAEALRGLAADPAHRDRLRVAALARRDEVSAERFRDEVLRTLGEER